MTKYFILFSFIFLLPSCNSTKIFYNYGDFIVSWQVDNYFDITSEQEEWIEEKIVLHLEWHRKEELPKYKNFLTKIKDQAQDGISMSELNEAFSMYEIKRNRIFERITPDVALFLAKISPSQIDYLEKQMIEENEEMAKKTENHHEQLVKRREYFFEQMEDWFGELSKNQIKQLNEWQNEWYKDSSYTSRERLQLRLVSQNQFLTLLRSNPNSKELEKWLNTWTLQWTNESNPLREKRIIRNKKRILKVENILTPKQRLHALQELDYWIEVLEQTILDN